MASRVATHVGAPLLATRLALRALRADPTDAQALEQYGYELIARRGPLELRKALADHRREDRSAADSADLLALESYAALLLRDFAAAEQLVTRAESLMPGRAWVRLQRAFLLERLDRLEEALEVVQAACKLHPHPFFRAGVLAYARLLQLLNRDDDAIDLLQRACGVLRSGPVAAQLYSLLSENGRWLEAESALQTFANLSPLLESRGTRWLIAEQARVAYRLGKRPEAASFAKQIDDDFFRSFAKRLLEPPPADETVRLDISFVRQHFKTCAPATLAAIGAFWKMPADHVRLAEAICYDGTPPWEQRDWAARNGWHVREFRVTRESALALLARRVPFAITTVEATSAHMMAVIGFDLTRDVLLLRDPSQPYVIEFKLDAFFERYRPFGPRGMLFIPEAERSRIDGVDLPDSPLYDDYHQISLARAPPESDAAPRPHEKN
jgi:tetratricopeptide (TPR) repeat protein